MDEEKINDTIEDRVFVCIGRYKKLPEKQAVWVMTIDKDWQIVTMWDPVKHKETELKGRIRLD